MSQVVFFLITLLGALVFGALLYLVGELFEEEEVFNQDFWWRDWDGCGFSTAYLMRLKHFKFIRWKRFIDKSNSHDPRNHPKYAEFLKKVKEV